MNKKEKDKVIEYLKSKEKPVRVVTLCLDLELHREKFVQTKPFSVKVDFVPGPNGVMPVAYLRNSVVINGITYASIPAAAAKLDRTIKWVWENMENVKGK